MVHGINFTIYENQKERFMLFKLKKLKKIILCKTRTPQWNTQRLKPMQKTWTRKKLMKRVAITFYDVRFEAREVTKTDRFRRQSSMDWGLLFTCGRRHLEILPGRPFLDMAH